MFDKIKNIFKEKDEKKKTENLIAFLIILVITLIIVNKILSSDSDSKTGMYQNQTGVELVSVKEENTVLVNSKNEDNLKSDLEDILSKIRGVRQSRCFGYLSKR